MDISVSQLNRRVALQVPPELPLGFVLIVGNVHNLSMQEGPTSQRIVPVQLRDGDHLLDCQLPSQLLEETMIKEGDRVRLGGQLAFDTLSARYRLRVHHLEVLASSHLAMTREGSSHLPARSDAPPLALAPPDLPRWVRQLAPPEIQRELGFDVDDDEDETASGERGEPGIARTPALQTTDPAPSAGTTGDLPPEMVHFLSEAMDSDADVELTPEILDTYGVGVASSATLRGDSAHVPGSARARQPVTGQTTRRQVERTLSDSDELPRSIAAWLSNPQLYVIPLLMVLIFLTAVFIFVMFQQ